jgi:hypothetical protein
MCLVLVRDGQHKPAFACPWRGERSNFAQTLPKKVQVGAWRHQLRTRSVQDCTVHAVGVVPLVSYTTVNHGRNIAYSKVSNKSGAKGGTLDK